MILEASLGQKEAKSMRIPAGAGGSHCTGNIDATTSLTSSSISASGNSGISSISASGNSGISSIRSIPVNKEGGCSTLDQPASLQLGSISSGASDQKCTLAEYLLQLVVSVSISSRSRATGVQLLPEDMSSAPNITDLPLLPLSNIYNRLSPADKRSLFSTCIALHRALQGEHLCALRIHVHAPQSEACNTLEQPQLTYSVDTPPAALTQLKAFPFSGGCVLRKLIVYSPSLEVWQLLESAQGHLRTVTILGLDAWVPRLRNVQKIKDEGIAVSKIICSTCPCIDTLELLDGSLYHGAILDSFAAPNMTLRTLVIKRFSGECYHTHKEWLGGGLESGIAKLKNLELVCFSAAFKEKLRIQCVGASANLHTLHLQDVSIDNAMLAKVLEKCTCLKDLMLSNSVVNTCRHDARLLAEMFEDEVAESFWFKTPSSHSLEVLRLDGKVEVALPEWEACSLRKVIITGCLPLFSISRSEEKELELAHRGALLSKYVDHLACLPVEWDNNATLVLDGKHKVVYRAAAVAATAAASSDGEGARAPGPVYIAPGRYDAAAHASAVVRALSRLSGSSLARGLRALRLEGLSLAPGHLVQLALVFPNVRRVELGSGCTLLGAGAERGAALVQAFAGMTELEVMAGATVSAGSVLAACTAAQQQRSRLGSTLSVELQGELLAQCRQALRSQPSGRAPRVCIALRDLSDEPDISERHRVRSEDELWDYDLVGRS